MKTYKILTLLARSIANTGKDSAHMAPDDKLHFAKQYLRDCQDPIRKRILIERAIVRQVLTDIVAMGFTFNVYYGGGQYAMHGSIDNVHKGMCEIGACDEERVYIYQRGDKARCVGSILLVYGNDGYDVIADHSDNGTLAMILVNAEKLSEVIESVFISR